ncbi:unnamed protein product [Cuscuta epithymum]|uniref:Uncharacterized protein n=1 Tax=Cuscuta epithymum TaxID=186058 RepID=A0AAV0E9Y2_9ASTE|nr:unnamed protein product [Cuscuta epithymum]
MNFMDMHAHLEGRRRVSHTGVGRRRCVWRKGRLRPVKVEAELRRRGYGGWAAKMVAREAGTVESVPVGSMEATKMEESNRIYSGDKNKRKKRTRGSR